MRSEREQHREKYEREQHREKYHTDGHDGECSWCGSLPMQDPWWWAKTLRRAREVADLLYPVEDTDGTITTYLDAGETP